VSERATDWSNPRSVAAWYLRESRRLHRARGDASGVTSRKDNNRVFDLVVFLRQMARRIALQYEDACPHCERRKTRRRSRLSGSARATLAALLLALTSPLAAQGSESAGIEPATVSTGELSLRVSTRNSFAVTHQGRAEDNTGPVEQSPDVLAEPDPPRLTDYLAPAAWCPLRRGDPEPGAFGCDGGIAANLVDRSWERFTLVGVAFVGAETVGAGIAGCRGRLCAGLGVAARRNDFGIDLDTAAPVVGATFSLGGLRE
jgi:hypothetical protein